MHIPYTTVNRRITGGLLYLNKHSNIYGLMWFWPTLNISKHVTSYARLVLCSHRCEPGLVPPLYLHTHMHTRA